MSSSGESNSYTRPSVSTVYSYLLCITLNTAVDYEHPKWRRDGSGIWEEPYIRNDWGINIGEGLTSGVDQQHPRTKKEQTDLADTLSRLHLLTLENEEGKMSDRSFHELYDPISGHIVRLYGDMLTAADESAARALSYAVSHMPGKEDVTKQAFAEDEVQQMATGLVRAHVVSVLGQQVDIEYSVNTMSEKDIARGEAANSEREECVQAVIKSSRAHMDRSILEGTRASLVWDDQGARLTFVTPGLSVPADDFSFTRGSANVDSLFRVDTDEPQSFLVINNERRFTFEDASGSQINF
ncbi:hypothetical protein IAR50_000900 [Cryptococcus sp. DSM 104548]